MIGYNCGCTSSTKRIFAYTLQGAFPVALFLTDCFEVAKFLNRQNQSVQKTPFSICCFLPAGKWSHYATILFAQGVFYKLVNYIYSKGVCMTSSCSVTTRDNPNEFGFSSRWSIAWPLFHLSHSIFLLFKHLHIPLCAYLKILFQKVCLN